MLIEAPIGHLSTEPVDTPIDWLDLSWSESMQRALRKSTRGGQTVRLLLGLGATLRHGDVLRKASPGVPAIVVNVPPSPVLVARVSGQSAFCVACYELGSLHVPVQIELDGHEIITIPDGPVEGLLDRLGIPWEIQTRRFEPTLLTPGQVVVAREFAVNRRPSNGQPTPEIAPLPRG